MAEQRDGPLSSEDWSSKDDHTDKHIQGYSANHKEDLSSFPTSDADKPPTPVTPQKTSTGLSGARTKLGLHPAAPVAEEHDEAEHSDLWWPKVRIALKEPFAEFWGTFILVLFGDGSVAQVLLSTNQKYAPGGDGFGDYQSINWGWGIGSVTTYAARHVQTTS